MSERLIQVSTLTEIADAIRDKKGTVNPIPVSSYASEIASIETGGGQSDKPFNLVSYINHTLTEVDDVNEVIKRVVSGGSLVGDCPTFSYQTLLSYVNLPKCDGIAQYAFMSCTELTSVNIPVLTGIPYGAFSGCTELTSINMPAVKRIYTYAFYHCTKLSGVLNAPELIYIEASAISNTAFTEIYAPKCSHIGQYALNANMSITVSEYCAIHCSCGLSRNAVSSGNNTGNYYSANSNPYYALAYIGYRGAFVAHPSCKVVCAPISAARNITSIDFSNIEYIPSGAFSSSTYLSGVTTIVGREVVECGGNQFSGHTTYGVGYVNAISFPKLKYLPSSFTIWCSYLSVLTTDYLLSIGASALRSAVKLQSISISKDLSFVGEYALYGCTILSTPIDVDASIYIGSNAFMYCRSIPYVRLNNCETIASGAFQSCNSISFIDLPTCININMSAFSSCSSLSSINLPACESISGSAFYSCVALPSVYLPNCKYIGYSGFRFCSELSTVVLPNIERIETGAFASCPKLSVVRLTGNSVAYLGGSAAFGSTPITLSSYLGYFGSIGVRQSLLESWKTKTNWTYLSARFVGMYSFAINGSEYFGVVGSTYSAWCDNGIDNPDGYVVSGTSIFTADGTQYVEGMNSEDVIADGAVFNLANV